MLPGKLPNAAGEEARHEIEAFRLSSGCWRQPVFLRGGQSDDAHAFSYESFSNKRAGQNNHRMASHDNSNQYDKPHHLTRSGTPWATMCSSIVFSHELIGDDWYFSWMRFQVDFLNFGVKWLRFFARVLLLDCRAARNIL